MGDRGGSGCRALTARRFLQSFVSRHYVSGFDRKVLLDAVVMPQSALRIASFVPKMELRTSLLAAPVMDDEAS
jgi:hypothetical protein